VKEAGVKRRFQGKMRQVAILGGAILLVVAAVAL